VMHFTLLVRPVEMGHFRQQCNGRKREHLVGYANIECGENDGKGRRC
jgi:hypothetical protein